VPKVPIFGTVSTGKAQKAMENQDALRATPSTVFGTVASESKLVPDETILVPAETMQRNSRRNPPRKRRNRDVRSREYLTTAEVEKLIKAAGSNRYGWRDGTMVLTAFRHGLRPIELTRLQWSQVDLDRGELHVARVKGSKPSVHPLTGREVRALRRVKREQEPASPFVFTSERGGPFTTRGYHALVARLGERAEFDYPVHPHQLRHACGYALINRGVDVRTLQAFLGHANVTHTVKYAELAPGKFRNFWDD
jgi:integrase